jgi:hypothetical protein
MHSSDGVLSVRFRWVLARFLLSTRSVTYLLSFILAIPRSACATLSSDLSNETGGKDSSAQVSALMIRGSMRPSSSSMRDHINDVFEFVFKVTSRSITNWVAETITC